MRVFIIKISIVVMLVIMVISTMFIGIIKSMGPVFSDTYQSVIQRKYNKLKTTNSPKIIIIGGSSSSFGINNEIIEESTGYEVVNLGLHAGFGANFATQLSKENINKGDIVILAYEYGWNEEKAFDEIGAELVMSGIDNNISMYKHIRPQNYDDLIGYLIPLAEKKIDRITTAKVSDGSVYSSNSFNEEGEMIFNRQISKIQLDYDTDKYGVVNVDEFSISKQSKKYLKDYKKFVEGKGAKIFFTSAPIIKSAAISSENKFEKIPEYVENEMDIKYISNPTDYFFDSEYMYDTIYHLNNEGEKIRSVKLADDINKALEEYN